MRGTDAFRLAGLQRHLAGTIPAQVAATALGGAAMIAALTAVLPATAPGLLGAVLAFLLASMAIAVLMRRFYPHRRIGGCNVVTLLRAGLVCALLMPLMADRPAGWAVAVVAGIGLAMDGLDGFLARRSGLVSGFGARFDMEVDAALALVLALHIIAGTAVGAEVLVLGLIRYVFVLAGLGLPWLQRALSERRWRKAICVIQIAALIVLQTPLLPPGQGIVLARIVALLLIGSFAVDIRWLWRRR